MNFTKLFVVALIVMIFSEIAISESGYINYRIITRNLTDYLEIYLGSHADTWPSDPTVTSYYTNLVAIPMDGSKTVEYIMASLLEAGCCNSSIEKSTIQTPDHLSYFPKFKFDSNWVIFYKNTDGADEMDVFSGNGEGTTYSFVLASNHQKSEEVKFDYIAAQVIKMTRGDYIHLGSITQYSTGPAGTGAQITVNHVN